MKNIIRTVIILGVTVAVIISALAPFVGKPVPVESYIPLILSVIGLNYMELTKNSSNED